jgi:YidC/Oxa1 family membrane protein insertase
MYVVFANVLQPLINLTEAIMVWLHDHATGGSWGWAIVGLTVVVRVALLPLTLRQFKSMQALQRLQPEIKALQAKYKEDKQRLNQEMMKFYQENKVNPLGSCLPLVAQMPIFISLFYMLQKDLKHDICPGTVQAKLAMGDKIADIHCGDAAQFLFIPDLTAKATGAVLITLILLYVGSQVVSSLLMTVSADANQRRIMMALPLIFVFFVINFPAGLIVYWITTNLWTILQQFIVKKTVGPLRPPAGTAGEPVPAGAAAAVATGNPKAKPARDEDSGSGNGAGAGASKAKPPPPPRRRKKARSGRRR